MKKTAAACFAGILTALCLLLATGCGGGKDEWVSYKNSDGTIEVFYLSRSDVLSYIAAEDDMLNIYRPGLFTLTVSVRGYAPDLDTVGKNLAVSYTTDKLTVADGYSEAEIAGFACRKLRVTGEELSDGAVMYFTDPATGYYYEIFYTIAAEADESAVSHVGELLDRLVLAKG